MSHICPSCGFNLAADKIVESAGWQLDPRGAATFEGRTVRITATRARILHTLASLEGRLITAEALLSRVSDSENPNTIAAFISQMRKSLSQQGIPCPIETVWHHGYRWAAHG